MIDWEELSYDEARGLKEALEAMLDSEGWAIVRAFISERVTIRAAELVNYNIETQEQIARYNRLQGEMQELARFPEIIAQYCSDLAVEVKKLQDEAQGQMDFEPGRRD